MNPVKLFKVVLRIIDGDESRIVRPKVVARTAEDAKGYAIQWFEAEGYAVQFQRIEPVYLREGTVVL